MTSDNNHKSFIENDPVSTPARQPLPYKLNPDELAFFKRLKIELALAGTILCAVAFSRSLWSGATALLATAVTVVNLYWLKAGLKVTIFDAAPWAIVRGILSFLGRFLLLAGLFFAIIRDSRFDSIGLVLGCMTVVSAIFLEAFYLLFREFRSRWNTKRF